MNTKTTNKKMYKMFDKFLLLLWKNSVIQKRHPFQTLFEILIPIALCAVICVVRSLVEAKHVDPIKYGPFDPFISDLKISEMAFSPNNTISNKIMENLNFNLKPFDDAKQLEDYLLNNYNKNKVKIGVVFDIDKNADELPNSINFKLRFPAETDNSSVYVSNWKTNLLFPMFKLPGPREREANKTASPDYYRTGFLSVQKNISMEIINYLLNKNNIQNKSLPNIVMQRYPYPEFNEDLLMQFLPKMIYMIMLLAFMYPVINITKVIAVEKERQLKESMKIMGLPGWLHWTAWFTKSLIFLTISMIVIVILFKVDVWYDEGIQAVFPRTNWFLFFMFLFLYSCSMITYAFMFSVFFSKANLASILAGGAFFFFVLPYTLLDKNYESLALGSKLLASILSNSAMAYGFQLICMFESIEEGIQWNNLWRPVTPDDNLCMGYILLMLIADSLLYLLITLYVEAVFPGPYGVPKKWNFFLPFSKKEGSKIEGIPDDNDLVDNSLRFEREPDNLKAGILISHLRKVFEKHSVAVKDLSLNMYEDQITVLLGHNGAGKTTTISMLTGMLPVTSGTATINGYDVTKEIGEVRTSLGFCPQHNILFDDLTVTEHIYFYSKLKGMKGEGIQKEIDNYLRLLQFEDKRNKKSSTLSGGMKRKLSVAVAFCGNSKVVMLDEPTAGMDPTARRALWELVESQKKHRTILLTTHFMDEADLLGDRIAIMAGGELQCCGSSFFLKKRYGAGYHLVMDKGPDCNVQNVTNLIKIHIPQIIVNRNVGSELVYLLSKDNAPVFEDLLKDIEVNSSRMGIRSYGISLTTLEEVFMKVGADHGQVNEDDRDIGAQYNANNYNNLDDSEIHIEESRLLTGSKLTLNQVKAMFLKRILTTWRSWAIMLTQILLPILMIIASIQAGKASEVKDLPNLDITLNSYAQPVTLLSGLDQNPYYVSMKQMLNKQNHEILDIESSSINDTILALTSEDSAKVSLNYITGATFGEEIVACFNNDPYHSPPLALNLAINSILKAATNNETYEINVSNQPLPFTLESRFLFMQQNSLGFQLASNIGVVMGFVSALFILFYIRERVSQIKHLQLVSGVNIFIFWLVSFIWDWITFIVTIIFLMITLVIHQENGFKTVSDMGRLSVVFIYFAFSMLPCIYLASFFYNLPSTGYTRIVLYLGIFGSMGFIIVELLSFEALGLTHIAKILDWIFMLMPNYSLSSGIGNLYNEFSRYDNCQKAVDRCFPSLFPSADFCWELICEGLPSCCRREEEYFRWETPGILRNIIISMLVGVVLLTILLMKEYSIFKQILYAVQKTTHQIPDSLDENLDVIEENNRIRNMTNNEINKETLVLRNVTKYYGKFLAVNRICLGVNRYECFGLLGVNGAGKTTTFKMITGDTDISFGDVFVNGLNLKKQMKEVNKLIGYCPQFDALLDDLTARETIRIFCLIRGIAPSECDYHARRLARDFDFYKHLDKKVRELSGGNKRKLSTAIALIGDPPILYLDEPTTGMDPATKRFLWNALCKLRDSGKCLILTSHSMEECEALCTRLAIMVNGSFKCLGSTQHLKSQYSDGRTLIIKLRKEDPSSSSSRQSFSKLDDFIKKSFPRSVLRDKHQELMTYYISDTSVPWSKMFGIMEKAKSSFNIEDYSLGQSSLEQVFLNLTKLQQDEANNK